MGTEALEAELDALWVADVVRTALEGGPRLGVDPDDFPAARSVLVAEFERQFADRVH